MGRAIRCGCYVCIGGSAHGDYYVAPLQRLHMVARTQKYSVPRFDSYALSVSWVNSGALNCSQWALLVQISEINRSAGAHFLKFFGTSHRRRSGFPDEKCLLNRPVKFPLSGPVRCRDVPMRIPSKFPLKAAPVQKRTRLYRRLNTQSADIYATYRFPPVALGGRGRRLFA